MCPSDARWPSACTQYRRRWVASNILSIWQLSPMQGCLTSDAHCYAVKYLPCCLSMQTPTLSIYCAYHACHQQTLSVQTLLNYQVYALWDTHVCSLSPCEQPYKLPHNTFLCGLANPQQHTTPSASNPLKDWQHSSGCFNKTAPNNTSTCHPMPFSNYAASTWYTYKLQLVSCSGVGQPLP